MCGVILMKKADSLTYLARAGLTIRKEIEWADGVVPRFLRGAWDGGKSEAGVGAAWWVEAAALPSDNGWHGINYGTQELPQESSVTEAELVGAESLVFGILRGLQAGAEA